MEALSTEQKFSDKRPMGSPAIRVVDLDEEKSKIFQLRYEIYIAEMKRNQGFACHDSSTVREPMDETAVLIGAFQGEQLVGTSRINFSSDCRLDHREIYDFDRFEANFPGRVAFVTKMMVRPEYRGGPLFHRISYATFQTVAKLGGAIIVIDCNDHLVRSFNAMGFYAYKGKVVHPEFGPVTPMAIDVINQEHLQQIRSPLVDPSYK